MGDNLCDGIDNKFKTELSKMRKGRNSLTYSVNDLKDKMDILDSTTLTNINEVRNTINNARLEAASKMNTIENSISSLTGSCLDGVFNELGNTMRNLNNFIDGLLPKNSPEIDILSGLGVLSDLLNKLGISDIISNLDELLGCLSDSDCLPVGDVQSYYDEIDMFISSNGLTDQGGFDQDEFMNKMDISTKVKNGLNTFKSDMSNLSSEISEITGSTTSKVQKAAQPKVNISNQLF